MSRPCITQPAPSRQAGACRLRRWVLCCAAASLVFLTLLGDEPPARDNTGRPRHFGITDGSVPDDPREAMRSGDFPTWDVSRELPNDVFTFARLRYRSESRSSNYGGYGGRSGRRDRWLTDYPDSDLNFSYRLQQLTALQVNPRSAIVDINYEQMRHYPFIYMIEVGRISITDEEAHAMREYMLNGGFIMVDDFWGISAWETFYTALKQIFPTREPEELPLSHDIFHIVFDLKVKPQIPHVRVAVANRGTGITYEQHDGGTEEVHYRGVKDDKGRLMMLICHNTDIGDGWEEEGTDPWYFREFSEKYAYPLGINIIFYAMTH
jgi:hypothetical protein